MSVNPAMSFLAAEIENDLIRGEIKGLKNNDDGEVMGLFK